MNSFAKNYAVSVLDELLKLKAGEELLINFEYEFEYFALLLKDTAQKRTKCAVRLLYLKNGRPCDSQVFEPEEFFGAEPVRRVLLHLYRLNTEIPEENDFERTFSDLNRMNFFGHLSDPPVTGRKIAIPWCNVPVAEENDDEAWAVLENRYNLSYRQHELNAGKLAEINEFRPERIEIRGEGTCLDLRIADDSVFSSCRFVLEDGRDFFSSPDSARFFVNVDSSETEGEAAFCASILGNCVCTSCGVCCGALEFDEEKEPLLSRFFEFSPSTNKIAQVAVENGKLSLILGTSALESLNLQLTEDDVLPSQFCASMFKIEISPADCEAVAYNAYGDALNLLS